MAQPGSSRNGGRVVVAGDEMLGAVQAGQERGGTLRRNSDREIAQMPDGVAGGHRLVPALDQGRVHLGDRSEGASKEAKGAAMAEMGVGGE